MDFDKTIKRVEGYEDYKKFSYRDGSNYEQWIEYDSNGNKIHFKDSDRYEVWYEYDSNGNEIHTKDSRGEESWREYNDKGKEVHYKVSNGYEKWTEYDPSGTVKIFEHDSNGTEVHYNDGDLERVNCTFDFNK